MKNNNIIIIHRYKLASFLLLLLAGLHGTTTVLGAGNGGYAAIEDEENTENDDVYVEDANEIEQEQKVEQEIEKESEQNDPAPPPPPPPPPPSPPQQQNLEHINRQLVIFCGPHQTGTSSIQRFLTIHAAKSDLHAHDSFQNWTFPVFTSKEATATGRLYRDRLDLFVTHAGDEALQEVITGELLRQWNHNNHINMIIGSAEFDRFGTTPFTEYDAKDALKRILNALLDTPYPPTSVKFLVNYRTPRYNQWTSIWKEWMNTELDAKHYHMFMCKGGDRVWESLDCEANPLRLLTDLRALARQHFPKLPAEFVVLDMGGINNQGRDISHAIACDILKVPCTSQGWIVGMEDSTVAENTHDLEFNSLNEEESDVLEQLLRNRDCAYQETIEKDVGVSIVNKFDIFDNCIPDKLDVYTELMDTDKLLNLMKSQKDCPSEPVKISDFLVPPGGGGNEQSKNNNNDNNNENDVVQNNNEDQPNNNGNGGDGTDGITETNNQLENSGTGSDKEEPKGRTTWQKMELPLFLLIAAGVGVVQYVYMQQSRGGFIGESYESPYTNNESRSNRNVQMSQLNADRPGYSDGTGYRDNPDGNDDNVAEEEDEEAGDFI